MLDLNEDIMDLLELKQIDIQMECLKKTTQLLIIKIILFKCYMFCKNWKGIVWCDKP